MSDAERPGGQPDPQQPPIQPGRPGFQPNAPYGQQAPKKVDQSTIRWSRTNNPLKNARVTLDSSDPTAAEATFYPEYNFKARGSVDGRSASFDGAPIGFYSFRSTGDLSGDKVTVKLVNR